MSAVRGRIPRRTTHGPARASHLQQGLWILDQIEGPGSNTTYTLTSMVRLHGRLDVAAIQDSITAIVRRHEVLHSVLKLIDGNLYQVVLPVRPVTLRRHDLSELAASERAGRLSELVGQETEVAFDLASGPLLRVSLIKVSALDQVLVLNVHHAVFDGWSVGIFFSELGELYRSRVEGKPSELPDLAIQYADFAEWQRTELVEESLRAQAGYWCQELAGLARLLALPADRPRPAVPSFRGAKHAIRLTAAASERLRALCRAARVTPFMVLLAAYQTLLSHWSGQTDVAVGTVFAGRRSSESQSLIGYFANAVVLRSRLSGASTFTELLADVKRTCLAAYEHQDIPFERLVDELSPRRSPSHNPLFQVALVLQDSAASALHLPNLEAEAADVPGCTSKFDLSLVMREDRSGFDGEFEYSTDLFDAETIGALGTDFVMITEAAVSWPDRSLGELTGTTAGPRRASEPLCVRGYLIDPGAVEQVLAAHPLVEEVIVAPYQDFDGSRSLAAFAVGRQGREVLDGDVLRGYATQRLANFLVPSAFVILPELPRTTLGKVDRSALPVPGASAKEEVDDGQWTPMERILAGIWSELLMVEDIGRHEDFFALGGHSFTAVRLTDRIAEATGVDIAAATVFQAPTVTLLAALVEERRGCGRSTLVPLRVQADKPTLVLVHPIGGGLLCYRRLVMLCAEWCVYGLEARSVDGASACLESVEDIAAAHLAALDERDDLDHLVLGGWSMGGVIAFEMARQRQRAGRAVPAVVMLDSFAPQETQVAVDDAESIRWLADEWGLITGTGLKPSSSDLPGLSPARSVELLHERAVAVGAVDAGTGLAVVERLVNTFRTHARALHAYRPEREASVPILLLSSESSGQLSGSLAHGWTSWTAGEVRVVKLPGDHYSILCEPHVRQVADELAAILG